MSGRCLGKAEVMDSIIKDYLVSAALHQVDRVRHFLETEGLHPDCTYGGKPTALCYAVLKPHLRLMTYLLDKGANIRHTDRSGMTPLHYAALGGSQECVGYLICCGADLDQENHRGDTPLTLTLNRSDLAGCRRFLLRCGAACGPHGGGARRFCLGQARH